MEATFVRLESLTYFSLTPIPLFGSGYAGLGSLEQLLSRFLACRLIIDSIGETGGSKSLCGLL